MDELPTQINEIDVCLVFVLFCGHFNIICRTVFYLIVQILYIIVLKWMKRVTEFVVIFRLCGYYQVMMNIYDKMFVNRLRVFIVNTYLFL